MCWWSKARRSRSRAAVLWVVAALSMIAFAGCEPRESDEAPSEQPEAARPLEGERAPDPAPEPGLEPAPGRSAESAPAREPEPQPAADAPAEVPPPHETEDLPAVQAEATAIAGTTSRDTALKEAPTLDSAELATLPAGTALTVLETRGGWYRVRSSDREGWLRMVHVRLADEAIADAGGRDADLETGRRGAGNIGATTGIRGLEPGVGDAEATAPPGTGEVAGTWRLSVGVPGAAKPATLTVARTEDGYTATYADTSGEVDVSELTVKGAQFTFRLERSTPAGATTLRYSGVVTGDRMVGEIRPRVGLIPFTGRRES